MGGVSQRVCSLGLARRRRRLLVRRSVSQKYSSRLHGLPAVGGYLVCLRQQPELSAPGRYLDFCLSTNSRRSQSSAGVNLVRRLMARIKDARFGL